MIRQTTWKRHLSHRVERAMSVVRVDVFDIPRVPIPDPMRSRLVMCWSDRQDFCRERVIVGRRDTEVEYPTRPHCLWHLSGCLMPVVAAECSVGRDVPRSVPGIS